jgi:hypothetical protein
MEGDEQGESSSTLDISKHQQVESKVEPAKSSNRKPKYTNRKATTKIISSRASNIRISWRPPKMKPRSPIRKRGKREIIENLREIFNGETRNEGIDISLEVSNQNFQREEGSEEHHRQGQNQQRSTGRVSISDETTNHFDKSVTSNHVDRDTSTESHNTHDITKHFDHNNHRDQSEWSTSRHEHTEHTIFITTETISNNTTK